MLLYLPLAHNYGRLMLLLGAHVGFTIAFLADPLRVAEALPQVRPTLLPSVPASTRRCTPPSSPASMRRPGRSGASSTGRFRRREVSRLESEGQPVPAGLRAKHRVADRLVFSKVREPFGGRLRMPGSGGAPLAKEIIEFFDTIGIRIVGGLRSHRVHDRVQHQPPGLYRFGSVGRPLPGFEVRIAEDERSRCARRRSSRATTRSPRRRLPFSGPTAG